MKQGRIADMFLQSHQIKQLAFLQGQLLGEQIRESLSLHSHWKIADWKIAD